MATGTTQKTILQYIQYKPMRCLNVSASEMCEAIATETNLGTANVYQSLRRLVRKGMVKQEIGKGGKSGYSINYNNHFLPVEILAKAQQHIKDVVDKTNDDLKNGDCYGVDSFGAKITKPATHLPATTLPATHLPKPVEKAEEEKPEEPAHIAEEVVESVSPTITATPTIEKSTDGKSITINLTINLSL